MRFFAYGAQIDSEIPFSGLPEVSDMPVISLNLKSGCRHHEIAFPAGGKNSVVGWRPIICAGGESPVYHIEGVGQFHLCPEQREICCTLMPETGAEAARYWLMHFIVPVYLLLDARFDFLHGSAVDIEGGAVAFLADAMGGKSTLANFFVEQRHALVTDDHLGLFRENGFFAVPSVPFVRPYRRLEDLGNPVERFAQKPLPLRAIYMLELGEAGARVVPLPGAPAVAALARNRRLVLSRDYSALTKERFSRLTSMTSQIPIAKLCVPRDLSRLSEVYQAVLSHLGDLNDPL
jgi:hypothetical protein